MYPIEDVPSIEESVVLNSKLPSVSERYFTQYYYVPKNQMVKNTTVQIEPSNLVADPTSDSKTDEVGTFGGPCKRMKLDRSPDEMEIDVEPTSMIETCQVSTELSTKMENDVKIVANEPKSASLDGKSKEYILTGEETLIMVHSNKLCVVSLSQHHPIVRKNLQVVKVEYEVFGVDRLCNKVSGKGKRGAQVMGSKATLCRLHTSSGQSYDVTCGARGKLVQVNEELVMNPDLCRTSWGSDGYLGIVMPRLHECEALIAALMPAEAYTAALEKQTAQT